MTAVEQRRAVLDRFGADDPVTEELLAYTENVFDKGKLSALPPLPLADEPHIEAWAVYAEEAAELGVVEALKKRFPQFRFPIEEGISQSDSYRQATRKGIFPETGEGPAFVDPSGMRLEVHESLTGRVPILAVPDRADFETLVRLFTSRNEPEVVPESMGACIVTGLNNWDRLHAYRRRWEEANPDLGDAGWSEEFRRVIPQKELYQDRFIILSMGPYSGVPAESVEIDPEEWLRKSFAIRREHECTHYFTYRILGSMRNNLLDELIADYVGVVSTFGAYRADLALRFFGLEDFPRYREGGRLENYRGTPPLSDAALVVLQKLVHAAVLNLERFDSAGTGRLQPRRLAAAALALASFHLEELARDGSADDIEEEVAAILGLDIRTVDGVALDRELLTAGIEVGARAGDLHSANAVPDTRTVPGVTVEEEETWTDASPVPDTRTLPGVSIADLESLGKTEVRARRDEDPVGAASEEFDRFAGEHAIPKKVVSTIQIALDELVSNVVKYGYDDDDPGHEIVVRFRLTSAAVEVEIIDDGHEFNLLDRKDPNTKQTITDRPIGGLGIYMVRKMVDECAYERREDRNHLRIVKGLA